MKQYNASNNTISKKGGITMKDTTKAITNGMQGELTQLTWHGGRQGDLDGGTWHGGRQGDLYGGTWHGDRQGDLYGGTWHGDRQGDLAAIKKEECIMTEGLQWERASPT